MTRHNLPSLIFELIEDPIVKALMAADGIDEHAVLDVLEQASRRLHDDAAEGEKSFRSRSFSAGAIEKLVRTPMMLARPPLSASSASELRS